MQLLESKEIWKWTLMIMQPEFITKQLFEVAREQVKKKKGFIALEKIRLEVYEEGLAAQTMHIGPYDAETPTIEKIHNFIKENG